MKAYFAKELPENPLYLNGKAYRFEFMETDDPVLINLLNSAASKRIGGVTVISQAEFEAKKKAQKSQPSLPKVFKREEVKQKVLINQVPRFSNRARSVSVAGRDKPIAVTPQAAVEALNAEAFIPKPSKGVLQ